MPRLSLDTVRPTNTRKPFFGKAVIFCEGQTETCYIQYFINKFKDEKYFDVTLSTVLIGGNSQAVLKHSLKFLADYKNNLKYGLDYDKYLIFDCDAPENIQEVLQHMKNYQQFKLLLTNTLFEVWLLMHFEDVYRRLNNKTIYKKLKYYIGNRYDKGNYQDIADIIEKGDLAHAIKNAKRLEEKYKKLGYSIYKDIQLMNPYTNVYQLIEEFTDRLNEKALS